MTVYERVAHIRLRSHKDRALTYLHKYIELRKFMREYAEEYNEDALVNAQAECVKALAELVAIIRTKPITENERIWFEKVERIIRPKAQYLYRYYIPM